MGEKDRCALGKKNTSSMRACESTSVSLLCFSLFRWGARKWWSSKPNSLTPLSCALPVLIDKSFRSRVRLLIGSTQSVRLLKLPKWLDLDIHYLQDILVWRPASRRVSDVCDGAISLNSQNFHRHRNPLTSQHGRVEELRILEKKQQTTLI